MKIRQINLDNDGKPEAVVAELSARELALIARMIGPSTHNERNEIQSDGGDVGSDLYNAADDVFNLFYDAGIQEVPR